MGKVPEPWVSQQKFSGKQTSYHCRQACHCSIFFFLIEKPDMSINFFFFRLISWKISIYFYIGFHKNKIKKFIGLNSQIFGTILGNFLIFINLIYLFIF